MKTAKQVMRYIPKRISKKLKDYVTDEVMSWSRYLFVWREGEEYYGHCTHCKQEYEVHGLSHKSITQCQCCLSGLKVQYERYGRSTMEDVEYVLFYEKALKDKTSIIARGFLVTIDYTHNDFRSVKTKYEHDVSYLFTPNKGAWMVSHWSYADTLHETVVSAYSDSFGGNRRVYVCSNSVHEAVQGTPFQYFNYDGYRHLWHWSNKIRDWTGYFNLVANYPCIEYLEKLGLREFVETKLKGEKTYSSINWNGETINQVLKVPKQNVKEVIKNANLLTPRILRMYQILLKENSSTTIENALQSVNEIPDGGFHENLMKVMKITKGKVNRIIRYIKKQINNEVINRTYEINAKMQMYIDYLDDCQAIGRNLKSDIVLYPRELDVAHRETNKQRKYKENKEKDEEIAGRAKSLKKLEYKDEKFIAKPFENTKEIIYEGEKLAHCIGQYIDRYAKGTTNLFAIRKINDINEPYYTMEVKGGKVSQFYGYDNNIGTEKDPEVIAFVKRYENEVLKPKERKSV